MWTLEETLSESKTGAESKNYNLKLKVVGEGSFPAMGCNETSQEEITQWLFKGGLKLWQNKVT